MKDIHKQQKRRTAKVIIKNETMFFNVLMATILMCIVILSCDDGNKVELKRDVTARANEILQKIDVSRGICVVLGDKKCEISKRLVMYSELVLYVQLDKDLDVKTARISADNAGLYGTRIYVDKGGLRKIHLADNVADAVVDVNETSKISKDEVLRVLRPEGIALLGEEQLVKQFPDGIDNWSHPFHGPDNNTQSLDQVARGPYLTQFFAEPHYAPATQVAVASAGRIFKGFGNVAFKEREEPYLNKLVAFNGYNGTMLWKREMTPGIMLHRNTMIATPDILYMGDDKSCKRIDTKTGLLIDEIIPPVDIAGGTYWKWMGMEDGVLYAIIGQQEQKDPVMRWKRQVHGWPWNAISPGFNQADHAWGFGRNILAIDPESKKVKWHYHEDEPIDSRGTCMKNGRIYLFRFGSFLTCLDAKSGKVIWKKTRENAPEFFDTFGEYLTRQGAGCNWRTRNYLMCSNDALYFAGPQIDKLLVVSTEDGSILWENAYNNYQLILRDDGLYGISADWGVHESKKFDPLTGEVLAELPIGRRACTRPNGTVDAILFRAAGGTVRLDAASGQPQWISPMRPPCHDGVTIANGMLYWWPYVCDCQLSIYGVTGLGPAGDYDFNKSATDEDNLQKGVAYSENISSLLKTDADWPSFRKNNQGTVYSKAVIPKQGSPLWSFPTENIEKPVSDVLGHQYYTRPTAPVTVDGIVFYSGSDGIVRALDGLSGNLIWKTYTGGVVRISPTIWNGRVFVGSGDGWVYCLQARTGEMLWRYRVAPFERKIPVYGSLQSTWPAASGILVENGVAYVAAGIVNYDGTHVYALDAETGKIKWQNNTSGHLLPEARTGVSVQGHMLLKDDKLYLASGTSLSPAIFRIKDGKCLNDPEPLKKCESNSPRGWELYLIGDKIVAGGQPFYKHPEQSVFNPDVSEKMLHTSNGRQDIVWINQNKVICFNPISKQRLNECVSGERYLGYRAPLWGNIDPIWEYNCDGSVAVAISKNAVIVAEKSQLVVLNIQNGKILWSSPLLYSPVPWGIAVSRDGRIIVSLEDGSVQCFGEQGTYPIPYLSSNKRYFLDSTPVALNCDRKGAEIRYTLDGSEPTQESKLYTKSFAVDNSITLRMRAFYQRNIPGFVVTEELKRVDYSKASDPEQAKIGLQFDYFEGQFPFVRDMDGLTPKRSGITTQVEYEPDISAEEFGYIFRGYILIPKGGNYTFFIKSNDGSKLYINDREVIDNDGGHGVLEKSGSISLQAKEYPFMVKYSQLGSAKALKVFWEGPDFSKNELTAEVLFYRESQ